MPNPDLLWHRRITGLLANEVAGFLSAQHELRLPREGRMDYRFQAATFHTRGVTLSILGDLI
jgi:hypothetical protein